LEDNGSVTTCGIPTSDPEPPVDIEFVEENYSKIIMKASWELSRKGSLRRVSTNELTTPLLCN
jgi:hypothetical protein